MKKIKSVLFLMSFCVMFMTGCADAGNEKSGQQAENRQESGEAENQPTEETATNGSVSVEDSTTNESVSAEAATTNESASAEADASLTTRIIQPEGMTLETRFAEPEGFSRIQAEGGSLTDFLRNYPLKEDGSPVLLYDGTEKGNQRAHAAVFELPIENEDLQQCADSIMRVYAEYFWESGQQERIAFHFVSGFNAEYSRWRDGERIQVDGNEVSWVQTANYDDSYEAFKKYLRYVFSYAGTLSMDGETEPISLNDLRVGDVFLKGGSPGHVVMVVDLCENAEGRRAFLLAQGYMPAQEFHVLKNPLHENDPWYYVNEVEFPFWTPEYTFEAGSLRRPVY